ncbi:hypothetical protein [Streptomyces sp. NPDC059874]|uniref:hypothetical protein n=1 Tax=Streptomyces sp. NPDC059874 TaxID=3346983 RepID=UPI0036683568
MQSEAQKSFIRDLNDLVKRYGLFIEAAGCCGELLVLGGKGPLDLRYDYEENAYRAF